MGLVRRAVGGEASQGVRGLARHALRGGATERRKPDCGRADGVNLVGSRNGSARTGQQFLPIQLERERAGAGRRFPPHQFEYVRAVAEIDIYT